MVRSGCRFALARPALHSRTDAFRHDCLECYRAGQHALGLVEGQFHCAAVKILARKNLPEITRRCTQVLGYFGRMLVCTRRGTRGVSFGLAHDYLVRRSAGGHTLYMGAITPGKVVADDCFTYGVARAGIASQEDPLIDRRIKRMAWSFPNIWKLARALRADFRPLRTGHCLRLFHERIMNKPRGWLRGLRRLSLSCRSRCILRLAGLRKCREIG